MGILKRGMHVPLGKPDGNEGHGGKRDLGGHQGEIVLIDEN